MKNLTNTTGVNTTGANTNANTKGEGTMRRQSKFTMAAKTKIEAAAARIGKMYDGYKTEEELMLPAEIRFKDIKDVVKLLSKNYAIADATGVVTEGVNRTLNAKDMTELSKSIAGCGEKGTEEKSAGYRQDNAYSTEKDKHKRC